jgi:hypothetical protein
LAIQAISFIAFFEGASRDTNVTSGVHAVVRVSLSETQYIFFKVVTVCDYLSFLFTSKPKHEILWKTPLVSADCLIQGSRKGQVAIVKRVEDRMTT